MSTYVVLLKYTKYVLDKQNYFYKKKKEIYIPLVSCDTRIRTLTPTAKMLCANHNYTISQLLSYLLTYVIGDKHFVLQIYNNKY